MRYEIARTLPDASSAARLEDDVDAPRPARGAALSVLWFDPPTDASAIDDAAPTTPDLDDA